MGLVLPDGRSAICEWCGALAQFWIPQWGPDALLPVTLSDLPLCGGCAAEYDELLADEEAFGLVERRCRGCGCTDDRACLHADGTPCHWVAGDLCSACAEKGVRR